MTKVDADEIARAWVPELERRSRDVAEGKVETVDAFDTCAEILTDMAKRRRSD